MKFVTQILVVLLKDC